jgi:hypothetical protein
MKTMWMLIFMGLPLQGIAYISWHLWVLVPLSGPWRSFLIGLLIGSFLLLFMNLNRTIDHLPLGLARLVYDVGNSSVFILLYLTIFFLVLDLGRLVHLVPRQLLVQSYYTTSALAIALFVIFLYGNIHYYNKVREELTLQSTKPLKSPRNSSSSATCTSATIIQGRSSSGGST